MVNGSHTGLIESLRSIVSKDGLLTSPSDLLVYECDGYTIEKNKPDVVVFPTSTEQVQAVVRVCYRERIPFVPRGSGTGLSGGALPVQGGVVISTTRMQQILHIDLLNV